MNFTTVAPLIVNLPVLNQIREAALSFVFLAAGATMGSCWMKIAGGV